MGTLQDALAKHSSSLKRHLFDYKIRLSGNCSEVVRIYTVEDKYGDETITKINNDTIIAIINYPTDIPLYRIRSGAQSQITSPTGTYLYDLLPIELFTQFKDNVEIGDIIVRKIKDENDEKILQILRVSETVGAFKTDIIWKKSNCSPHNITLTDEIKSVISNL